MNAQLPSLLAARLKGPLPGWAAQSRYQPELSFGRHRGPAPAQARPAAVLVLLYPCQGDWHLPLMLRPASMLDHAGQISLPGGLIEPGETSRQAALRELGEEMGVATDEVHVLGSLSPLYLFASNYAITPWVAAVDRRPSFQPCRREVERLLEVPLAHLRDPANTGRHQRLQRGLAFYAPCYTWQSDHIWGATSMILAELLHSLADCSLD